MDIRKLQRAIVDGLEDVKGHNIAVFNTEHLSPLFERVIIASGTSNRQTKALAASVRDAVKSGGFGVPRTEGEDNGEWIIVDCGAAVVHVMQPNIREYYHLEEIWGDKPVKMKIDSAPTRLVKAGAAEEPLSPAQRAATKRPAAQRALSARSTAAGPVAAQKAPPRKAAAPSGRRSAGKTLSTPPAAPRRRSAAAKTATLEITPRKTAPSRSAPRKAAPLKSASRNGAPRPSAAGTVTRTSGVKRPAAAKKAGRGG